MTTTNPAAAGWLPGPPPGLERRHLVADLRSYRRMSCARCGHRLLNVVPQHRGCDYRLSASCPVCGHAEVL